MQRAEDDNYNFVPPSAFQCSDATIVGSRMSFMIMQFMIKRYRDKGERLMQKSTDLLLSSCSCYLLSGCRDSCLHLIARSLQTTFCLHRHFRFRLSTSNFSNLSAVVLQSITIIYPRTRVYVYLPL